MQVFTIITNNLQIILNKITSNFNIYFTRKKDILSALQFKLDTNTINLSSQINKNYQSFNLNIEFNIQLITDIIFFYYDKRQILSITFNLNNGSSINKKFRSEYFDYDNIICDMIDINIINLNNYNYLKSVINDCFQLNSFQQLLTQLENNKQSNIKIIQDLLKTSQEYKNNIDKNQRELRTEYNKNILNNMKTLSNQLPNSTISNEIIIISPDNITITLFSNGYYNINKKRDTWFQSNSYLFLFCNHRLLYQLKIKNNSLINCLDNSIWKCINYNSEFFLTRENKTKVVILVITCQKRKYLINNIYKTWYESLSKVGILILFVIGDTSINRTYLRDNILFVNNPDNYESLPKKIYNALLFCETELSYNYIYKIDDDTVLNPIKFLSQRLDKIDYLGISQTITREFNRYWHRGKCESKTLNNIPYPLNRIHLNHSYAKGEAGYFLSKNAVQIILKHKSYIFTDLYEDKCIGEVLMRNGIKLNNYNQYLSKLYEKDLLKKNIKPKNYNIIVDVKDQFIPIYHNSFLDYIIL